jgi:hypothetical protein
LSLPPAYLSQKLTQPLPTKDGPVLRTIGEAANYMLRCLMSGPSTAIAGSIPPGFYSTRADAAAVSRQVHLALFYNAQLDISAMDA